MKSVLSSPVLVGFFCCVWCWLGLVCGGVFGGCVWWRNKENITSESLCFLWKLSLNKMNIKSLLVYWLEHFENENSVGHPRAPGVLCTKGAAVPRSLVPVFSVYELILSGSVSFGIVSGLTGFQTWWWSPWVLSLFHLWVFLLLEEKATVTEKIGITHSVIPLFINL